MSLSSKEADYTARLTSECRYITGTLSGMKIGAKFFKFNYTFLKGIYNNSLGVLT